MGRLYELLLFPDRAENLGQFSAYDVDLAHWKQLSAVFRRAFRTAYERGTSAILLVHGAQGTGKTLFSLRLEQDFKAAADDMSKGALEPRSDNLWHSLVGEEPPTPATIKQATAESVLLRVDPTSGWLTSQRALAKADAKSRVRILVIDDAHKDVFLREWAGLSHVEYLEFRARKQEAATLPSVAERLVEDCRGDFKRSVFLLLSNDAAKMEQLKEHVDRSHKGLASLLELPLPAADIKERIVRKNLNRLNRVSYWYCVDAARDPERVAVYDVLCDKARGFTESFETVDKALGSSDAKRPGRPANRNLITLVTLGTIPDAAKAFIEDHDMDVVEHYSGKHFGIWIMKEQWASSLHQGKDPEQSRRAKMVESEFALRWIALNMTATYALCQPPSAGDFGEQLLGVIRFFPSIAKPREVDDKRAECASIDAALDTAGWTSESIDAVEQKWKELGQRRSVVYEDALKKRLGGYGRGLAAYSAVKPDFIADEYKACAVTAASSNDPEVISQAIRRTCHTIEFTSHLRGDMEGLDKYLLEKVERYAILLESA